MKIMREKVSVWNSIPSHPLLSKIGGSPRIVLSNQNLLLMEYVEDEFTDALIDAICGEDLSSQPS